jgi:hypothetical protein
VAHQRFGLGVVHTEAILNHVRLIVLALIELSTAGITDTFLRGR